MTQPRPLGILYEHPAWFRPLFAELDRRGIAYERVVAHEHRFDPAAADAPYSLVVNRVSPSAYLRGHTSAIFYAQQYLAHLERLGVPVVNGTRAYGLELSKTRQIALLAGLGVPHPRTRVVNHVSQLEPAAAELAFPLIVKPNIGGSGALMRRFETPTELRLAGQAGELEAVFGLDSTALVQEYHPPQDGSIVRVEALDHRFLYAIRIHNDPSQGFNLCPADICQLPAGQSAQPLPAPAPAAEAPASDDFSFCAVAPPGQPGRKIEVADPPAWVVDAVLRIFRAADIAVGGVEYLVSARDGQVYVYDVNALSNFVTDAPALVGFDPFARFVDYLERRVAGAAAAGDRRVPARPARPARPASPPRPRIEPAAA